jgi:hypothetical protein
LSDDEIERIEQAGEIEPASAVVYAAPNQFIAEMACQALIEEGIPAVIGERVTEALSSIQFGEGFWGEVCVPPSQEERARAVLEAFLASAGDISEEELAAAAENASDPGV